MINNDVTKFLLPFLLLNLCLILIINELNKFFGVPSEPQKGVTIRNCYPFFICHSKIQNIEDEVFIKTHGKKQSKINNRCFSNFCYQFCYHFRAVLQPFTCIYFMVTLGFCTGTNIYIRWCVVFL